MHTRYKLTYESTQLIVKDLVGVFGNSRDRRSRGGGRIFKLSSIVSSSEMRCWSPLSNGVQHPG